MFNNVYCLTQNACLVGSVVLKYVTYVQVLHNTAAPRIYIKDRFSSVVHSTTTTYRMMHSFTLTNFHVSPSFLFLNNLAVHLVAKSKSISKFAEKRIDFHSEKMEIITLLFTIKPRRSDSFPSRCVPFSENIRIRHLHP